MHNFPHCKLIMKTSNRQSRPSRRAGFSLVEVALALGLVGYVLVALLGLFAIGVDSSRASVVDTAVARIARSVVATYDASGMVDDQVVYEKAYSYDGTLLASSADPEKHFNVTVTGKPSSVTDVPESSDRWHLIKIEITGADRRKVTLQASALLK